MPQSAGVLVFQPDQGRLQESNLLQCCHCQFTWKVERGSGKQRGFCLKCMKPKCGHPKCEAQGCVPWQEKNERLARKMEQRRARAAWLGA